MTAASNNRWNDYLKSLNLDSSYLAWEPDIVLAYKTSPSPNNDGKTCFPDDKGVVCKLRKEFVEKIKQKGIFSETLDYPDYGYTLIWIPFYKLCEEAEQIQFRVRTNFEVDLKNFVLRKIETREKSKEIQSNQTAPLAVAPAPVAEVKAVNGKTPGKNSASRSSVGKKFVSPGKTSVKGKGSVKKAAAPAKAPAKGKSKNNNLNNNYVLYRNKFKKNIFLKKVPNRRNYTSNVSNSKNKVGNNGDKQIFNGIYTEMEKINNNYFKKRNEISKEPGSNDLKSQNVSSNNPEPNNQIDPNRTGVLFGFEQEENFKEKLSGKLQAFSKWLSLRTQEIVGIKDTERDSIYLPLTLRNYEFCYNWKNVPVFFSTSSRGILALSILNSIDATTTEKTRPVSTDWINTLFPIHYEFCLKKNLNFLLSINAFQSYFWTHNELNSVDEQVKKQRELFSIFVPEDKNKNFKCLWSNEDIYSFEMSETFKERKIRFIKEKITGARAHKLQNKTVKIPDKRRKL